MPLLTFDELGSGVQKGTGSIREDLLDFIENISPHDTPLYNNLGQMKVNAGFVEYLEDDLRAAQENAFVEGAAATDITLETPARRASIVQNFQQHYWVSKRQQAVRHAGMASMLGYQAVKHAKIMKTDIELALHRGTATSGTTSVAPKLAGLLNVLTSTSSSGTTLTERVFNDIVTSLYSFNVNPREVYANLPVKRTINGFTSSVTRYIAANDRRQINPIEVYESEQGILALFKSRYQLSAAPSTQGNSFVVIDPDFFQVGWLRPLQEYTLGLDGDRDRRYLCGEATLIARSANGGVAALGYVSNIVA